MTEVSEVLKMVPQFYLFRCRHHHQHAVLLEDRLDVGCDVIDCSPRERHGVQLRPKRRGVVLVSRLEQIMTGRPSTCKLRQP